MRCSPDAPSNHNNRFIPMTLRLICFIILLSGLTACIPLQPRPDNTRTYALGLPDSEQNSAATSPSKPSVAKSSVAKGYIVRPQFPVYMEGSHLKLISENREIVNLPNAHWAEQMEVGVARAMSVHIETLNGGLKSDFYPWLRAGDAAFTLQLDFNHLIATSDGRILIAANWRYKHGTGETKNGVFADNTIEWLPGDAQSMVDGINEALKRLAAEIVDSLKK